MARAVKLIGNRYELVEQIGAGGMGIVYKALDRLRGEYVALKSVFPPLSKPEASIDTSPVGRTELAISAARSRTRPRPGTGQQETATSMWTAPFSPQDAKRPALVALSREFRTLASLRHPYIITVLDYGFDAHRSPFFTMELVSGGRGLLDGNRNRTFSERMELLFQIAQALSYLHRCGVLHRDLKPANILVIQSPTGPQVKVLDFGLAMIKAVEPTASAEISGTMAYMAPELLRGVAASESSDLYAFGATAFELLSGHPLFAGSTPSQLLGEILDRTPNLQELVVPSALRELLERLLAKDRSNRPSEASLVCAQLAESVGLPAPAETSSIRESFLQAAAFVAREKEVGELVTALDEALGGRGSSWLVGGESGVGKSRLLDEVRVQALIRGAQVLRGHALTIGGGSPYHVLRDVLRALCLQVDLSDHEASVLRALIPDLADLLERPVHGVPRLDAKATQEQLLRVIAEVFTHIQVPTVLLLEDIQWAGIESIIALGRLTRNLRKRPIVVIASYRDDEAPWVPSALPAMEVVKLSRFDRDSIAALSESMLGPDGCQQELVDLLQRETEGNVYFIVEVLRTLAEERGMLSQIGGGNLPRKVFAGGIRAVVERRLNRVPVSARPLLRLAAVAGRQLDLAVLRRVEPRIDPWLEACASVAVLEAAEEHWRFTHDKLRERLLEELSVEQRRALHLQTAEQIEQVYSENERDPTVLAYHYGEAGVVEKAMPYALQAGEMALREGAIQEALSHFERSLASAAEHEFDSLLVARTQRLAGVALLGLGRLSDCLARFREAWRLLGFPIPAEPLAITPDCIEPMERHIAELLVAVFAQITDVERAQQTANEVTELAMTSLSPLLSMGAGHSAYYVSLLGLRVSEKFNLVEKSAYYSFYNSYIVSLAPAKRLSAYYFQLGVDLHAGGVASENASTLVSGLLTISACNWDEALGCFYVLKETANGPVVNNVSFFCEIQSIAVEYYRGNYKKMVAHCGSLISRVTTHGNIQHLGWSHAAKALGLLRQGLAVAAEAELREAEKFVKKSQDLQCMKLICSCMASIALQKNDLREARQWADQALSFKKQVSPTEHSFLEGYATLVEVYLSLWANSTHPEERADMLDRLLQASADLRKYAGIFLLGRPRMLIYKGQFAAANGQMDRARLLWKLGLSRAQRCRMPYDESLAHRVLAESWPHSDPQRQSHAKLAHQGFLRIGATQQALLVDKLLAESP